MTPYTSASGTAKARPTSVATASGIQPWNCCAACKAGKSAARPCGANSTRIERKRMRFGSDISSSLQEKVEFCCYVGNCVAAFVIHNGPDREGQEFTLPLRLRL